ncbi:hypothetical protein DPMN_167893 [Dreissena polymorpha]|uniref:Uncharacterized protein n=1 Tax=Dreissena polymorpha TaxID=45954 RepID=A0A9D4F1K4_DREPO|nr:hypothetical protein DPMN_167893 [Dreissena polymorpha]
MSCSKSSNIHLPSGTDLDVDVMSSMKALDGDWRIPEMLLDLGSSSLLFSPLGSCFHH